MTGKLHPGMNRGGVPTWDLGHCDLLLGFYQERGGYSTSMTEMYVIKGDTWVITAYEHDDGVGLELQQLSDEQAVRLVRKRLKDGWFIPIDDMPTDVSIRLFQIPKENLPHDR